MSSSKRAQHEEEEDSNQGTGKTKAQRNAQRKRDHQAMQELHDTEEKVKARELEDNLDANFVVETFQDMNASFRRNAQKCSTKVVVKDAAICGRMGALAVKVARDASLGCQQFLSTDFITKVLQKWGEEMVGESEDNIHMNWEKMRHETAPYFCATPSCHFLATEMARNAKPKERKARQQSQRRNVEESQPEYGQTEDQAKKNNSEKRKTQMRRQLAKDQKLPLVDMVVNPKSFGETVENFFACSCLISEGEAGLNQDQEGNVIVSKTDAPADVTKDQINQKRCIIKFDYKTFRQMVEDRDMRKAHYQFNPDEEEANIPRWHDDDEEGDLSRAETAPKAKAMGGAPGGVHGSQGASKKRRS